MPASPLRDAQLQMARYLRNPETETAPAGIESRRLKIYQDLIYNNIEGFISGGFPVLHSLFDEEQWHDLVRRFIDGHRCHTPYFLEISQEFLKFLMEAYEARDCDPPFMAELAHYEWVELALDVSEEQLEGPDGFDPLDSVPVISPLAWLLSYQFPVQRIGASFRPDKVGEPVFLVVYRNREDAVKFMELNAATARLLELVRDNKTVSGTHLLEQLATELEMEAGSVIGFGSELLRQFVDLAIISHCNEVT
ncbi:MAG: putative DNA-binding domain-containing protein [Halioglobus sp.]